MYEWRREQRDCNRGFDHHNSNANRYSRQRVLPQRFGSNPHARTAPRGIPPPVVVAMAFSRASAASTECGGKRSAVPVLAGVQRKRGLPPPGVEVVGGGHDGAPLLFLLGFFLACCAT